MSNTKNLCLILFCLTCMISACTTQTEEAKIAAINQQIEPEGHLTSTHLYINWPAEYREGKRLLNPLKLKIPIEYLSNQRWLIQDHKITSLYLYLSPGAKPAVRVDPKETDSKEEAVRKYQYWYKTYVVILHRDYLNVPTTREEQITQLNNTLLASHGKPIREPNVDGLERYIQVTCYDFDRIHKEDPLANTQKELDYVASKAKDDRSSANCFSDRSSQYLNSPPENTAIEQSLFINCNEVGCNSRFSLEGRGVTIRISKENTFLDYEKKLNLIRNSSSPFNAYPQPLLSEVFTDLPHWREVVSPTRELLKTFVE